MIWVAEFPIVMPNHTAIYAYARQLDGTKGPCARQLQNLVHTLWVLQELPHATHFAKIMSCCCRETNDFNRRLSWGWTGPMKVSPKTL